MAELPAALHATLCLLRGDSRGGGHRGLNGAGGPPEGGAGPEHAQAQAGAEAACAWAGALGSAMEEDG
jgi:hypothetical protein